jgi:hypothetical protein
LLISLVEAEEQTWLDWKMFRGIQGLAAGATKVCLLLYIQLPRRSRIGQSHVTRVTPVTAQVEQGVRNRRRAARSADRRLIIAHGLAILCHSVPRLGAS